MRGKVGRNLEELGEIRIYCVKEHFNMLIVIKEKKTKPKTTTKPTKIREATESVSHL